MLSEVEAILSRLGQSPVDVDRLAAEVKRAEELLAACRKKLIKTDKELAGDD